MIKCFLVWLKGLYYTSNNPAETYITQENMMTTLTLVAVLDNQLADAVAADSVQATVVDDTGAAVSGVSVTFSADNGAKVTAVSTSTDEKGQITASVISLTAGSATVTATLTDGTAAAIVVNFSATTSLVATTASPVVTEVMAASSNSASDATTTSAVEAAVTSTDTTTASKTNTDTTTLSPLAELKTKSEAFFAFVEQGIKVLGKDAEAELVALKEKYL